MKRRRRQTGEGGWRGRWGLWVGGGLLVVVAAVGTVLLWRARAGPDLVATTLAERFLAGADPVFNPVVSKEFARAARDPKRWRQLDRIYRFQAVLLGGNPVLYRPLVAHFQETSDWVLVYVDHASLVYRREPARRWQAGDLRVWREAFAGRPARVRAAALAQLSVRLLAVGERQLAGETAAEAVALDPRLAEGWAQVAVVAGAGNKWEEALAAAGRALAVKGGLAAALFVKVEALSRLGRNQEAYAEVKNLTPPGTRDAQALFLHGRVAHAVKAYGEEVRVLRELVRISEQDDAPAGGYRIFLAQALAKNGEGRAAAAEFERALAGDDLSAEQREFAREALGRVRPAE